MTALRIKQAIDSSCVGLRKSERAALQRYFLSSIFPYYSQEVIGRMSDKCSHGMVSLSLKKISSVEYTEIRERVWRELILKSGRPQYYWLNPKQS